MAKPPRTGVVYSTNPDFAYASAAPTGAATLPPAQQQLRVTLDKKSRAGKQVTLITGFVGAASDLEALAKRLKAHCGCGGSAKVGQVLVQGDVRAKATAWLTTQGFQAKSL